MKAVATDSRGLFDSPLERVVGKRTATRLAKLGLETVGELVRYAPRRLAQRGELVALAQVEEGQNVTVVAKVLSARLRPMNARRGFLLTVVISDGTHELSLTFFGKSSRPLAYHEKRLSPGTLATFSGTVGIYRGALQLTHPEYEIVGEEGVDEAELQRPRPIYPAAQGVPTWTIAKAIRTVLDLMRDEEVTDPLPEDYRRDHGLMSAAESLRALHLPRDQAQWYAAQQALKHEEALSLQALLAQRAYRAAAEESTPIPRRSGGIAEAFEARLPYELTAGQIEVGDEIAIDLASASPMNRLLQGDVGAGKTIVALRAMLQVVDGGGQAALLAPTEVLAQQHYQAITHLLGDLSCGGTLGAPAEATRVDLLTGALPAKERRRVLAGLASGETGIIVGTHALLSDGVDIPQLSLAVVDEQHRFGVDQRDALRGEGVNLLVMTATPIPRTLAMTAFGDLETSELTELPKGRAEIATTIVPAHLPTWVDRVWERAAEEVAGGGRVFVICPRITPTEAEDGSDVEAEEGRPPLAAVDEVSAALADKPALSGLGIGTLTGPMSSGEKESAMARFRSGEDPILVATTVVEVGVDVPEATMMVILDADRFGLSQLHQLRGRIGRGTRPGLCLALSRAPEGTLAAARLQAFASTRDGFELAAADLELRGEGDVLGARQSGGRSHLHFLSVVKDGKIIREARMAAADIVRADPDLAHHPGLAAAVHEASGREETDYLERG